MQLQIAQITPRLQSELNSMKDIKSKVVVVCVFLKCITYITQKTKRKLFRVLQVLLYNNKLTFEVSEDISKSVFHTKKRRKKKKTVWIFKSSSYYLVLGISEFWLNDLMTQNFKFFFLSEVSGIISFFHFIIIGFFWNNAVACNILRMHSILLFCSICTLKMLYTTFKNNIYIFTH